MVHRLVYVVLDAAVMVGSLAGGTIGMATQALAAVTIAALLVRGCSPIGYDVTRESGRPIDNIDRAIYKFFMY